MHEADTTHPKGPRESKRSASETPVGSCDSTDRSAPSSAETRALRPPLDSESPCFLGRHQRLHRAQGAPPPASDPWSAGPRRAPLTTNTDVLPAATSTAHFVPRTAAMACGVLTWKPVPADPAAKSSNSALLCSRAASALPSLLRSTSVYRAPASGDDCQSALAAQQLSGSAAYRLQRAAGSGRLGEGNCPCRAQMPVTQAPRRAKILAINAMEIAP